MMLSGDELLLNENMMFEKFLSKFFVIPGVCRRMLYNHTTPVNFQLR